MSLYSNFARLEELNPDGYEANIAAWKEVLEDALEAGVFADKTCIEAGQELITDLNDRENGMPLSLNTVFDRMVADGTLVPLSRFRQEYAPARSQGVASRALRFLGWAAGLVSRPQWRSGAAEELRHEKYVDMAAVDETAARLVKALDAAVAREGNSRLSHVFSYEQVAQLDGAELSDTDLECGLSYAAATGRLYFDAEHNVVKLRKSGPITETDVTITSLRAQVGELAAREAKLSQQIDEYADSARRLVKSNRAAAKQFLQKKAIAEKSFTRTAALVDQLQTVLHKIDDASDNQQAVAALESSSRVLAELNQGTSVDDVDAVMESLQDEIEQTDTVSQSLAELRISPDAASSELDELEIDNELGEMEAEARAQKLADSFDKLPSVPQHRPGQAEPAKPAKAAKPADSQAADSQAADSQAADSQAAAGPARSDEAATSAEDSAGAEPQRDELESPLNA